MLELPEAYTLAAQMRKELAGKRVRLTIANASPHGFAFYSGDPAAYDDMLRGKAVLDAKEFGGRVEVLFEDGMVLNLFDGATPRLLREADKRPAKHQLLIEFTDGDAVVCTVQMYGGLQVYPEGAMDDNFYTAVSKEKPSPLSDAFNETTFQAICQEAKPNLSAKALLATEQRIPGLGNGCLQDILFTSHIHPKRKLQSLSDTELSTIYTQMKNILRAMADGGGRDTEKDLYGNPGGYRTLLSSKTWKDPCPVCMGGIERVAYMGGNVYFCKTCQPLDN